MRSAGARIGILAALALGVLAIPGDPATTGARSDQTDQSPAQATVGATPAGAAVAPGFVGASLEYSALHLYTGRDPRAVNPVLIQLLRNLVPAQSPVLRIGGDSADATWWPARGVIPPAGVKYALTPGWLRTTRALAAALGAKLIMGVNLAGGRPAVAAAEARAFVQGIGRRYLQALEIGNEPDVYGVFPWFHDRYGRIFYARSAKYSLAAFTREFSRWSAALPRIETAGPAFAELGWLTGLDRFLRAEPGVRIVTLHRYPLRAGVSDQTSPAYPSILNLLSDQASAGLAQSIAPYAQAAHARGLGFRLDELNSASNSGQRGVSDTFASALWVLDTLFNLERVGVDGVNIHSLPGAGYELFTFTQQDGRWQAFVHPEYYGLLMFEQAFPRGARALPVSQSAGPVKVWATRGADGHTRVVMINKDPATPHILRLRTPQSTPGTIEWLQAPDASATSGVTLGGQTFGDQTATGSFAAAPQTTPVYPFVTGDYSIQLPPASAAMLTQ